MEAQKILCRKDEVSRNFEEIGNKKHDIGEKIQRQIQEEMKLGDELKLLEEKIKWMKKL